MTRQPYSNEFIRNALLDEAKRLEKLLPVSDTVTRNLEAIKNHTQPDKMSIDAICSFVDLLHRSVPENV